MDHDAYAEALGITDEEPADPVDVALDRLAEEQLREQRRAALLAQITPRP